MSKKFVVRKSAAIIGLIGALSMSLFNSCTQDNPTAPNKEVPSYSFSGSVLDGYTGKALGGAIVTYYNDKGDSVTTTTNPDGGFSIGNIPYGDRSFFFSYRSTGTDTTKYTTAAVTLAGQDWENLGANVDSLAVIIKNLAGSVKLYPLTGSISGSVLSQVNDRSELNAVPSTVVKVTFTPKDNNQKDSTSVNGSNVEVGPRTFEASTDATGRFSITGLPVSGNAADKVTIKVVSVTSAGVDWAMVGDGIAVELVKGQSVPVGQIVLKPIVMDTLKALANNFKTGVVAPNDTFKITYSAALDTVASFAVLYSSSDSRNVVITTKISGKMITIDPAYSLVNGNQYQIKTFAYGIKGSSAIDTFNVTVAGGGLADVISSNILTDTKSPVNNIGVKDDVTFTFTDSIVSKSAKVMLGAEQIDVSVSASNKTLTISPKSIWKNNADAVVTVVLSSGKTVNFSTKIFTENALSFVTSNVCDFNNIVAGKPAEKNGLGLTDPIVFTTNKEINSGAIKVILKDSNGVSLPTVSPIAVAEGNQQISIQPINTLKPAAKYTIIITVENASGESKSVEVEFTTTAAKFFPVADNVRIGNDATMPVLDFAPNANIVIQMNNKITNASATLSSGSNVNVKITIQNDSLIIDPEAILTINASYNLDVKAEDSLGNTFNGRYVTGLKPQALVIVKESNIITADGNVVVNAERGITPWFKLSSAPKLSEMKALVTVNVGLPNLYSVDAIVSVNSDTVFVNPVADLKYDDTVTVKVTGVAADGNYISFVKSFKVMKKPVIAIVKSNVLNDNYEGLTNVAENVEMWYKLSRTPVASTVTAKTDGNNAVARVNGDTVFVKATYVFNADATVNVEIHGVDSEGLKFDLLGDGTNWPAFKIRPALFPVASNTWGVKGNGDPVKNFAFYDTMWVKFSQALSTNLLDITWQNNLNIDGIAGNDVDVFVTADPKSNPNAKAWVNGDTLFVLPDNRAAITWNQEVGFGVTVKTALGQASTINAFEVETSPLDLFIKATNTLRADGTERNDIGFSDTLFVVSSVKIDSIDDVTVGAVAGHVAPPDLAAGLIKTAVRLSTSKDTIFYVPKVAFVPGAKYTIDFNVFLSDDKNNLKSNVLGIGWEVKQGVAIFSANVFTSPTVYRKFGITGDSLVIAFTKAINYASTANPFTVNGAPWASATTSWSADAKTVTIKPVGEIAATAWVNDQNYYNVNELNGSKLTFDGVTTDGEVFATLDGKNKYVPEVRIVAEMGLALLSTNLLDSANNVTFALPVADNQDARDGVGTDSLLPIASNITLTFSRAVDTAKVKLNPTAYIKLWELVAGGANDIQNEITLAFSNSGKTITIDPAVNLKYATTYYVEIDNLPALISNATGVIYSAAVAAAGGYDNNHLFNNGFKTVSKTFVNISAMAVTDLGVDTFATTNADRRYGYSPAGGYTTRYKGPGALTVRFTELAWNANHDDSVEAYQVQVRTQGSKTTSWYTCSGTLTDQGFSAFTTTLKNRNGLTVDLTSQTFYNDLKTSERLPNVDYVNGDQVFNYGDTIALRIRPIRGGGDEAGEFGLWSNVIYFRDNVAPADSVMCATFSNHLVGGVSVSAPVISPNDGFGLDRLTRPALTYTITLTFPEDMDTSTDASLSTWWGVALDAGEAEIVKTGTFTSSNTYVITATFAANTDYTNNVPYFSVSVAGMKDASGVTIGTHGTNGGAANGVLIGTATTNDVLGSVNLQGLASF